MTKQSGFSLIELSIYFFIVGILAVAAIPTISYWVNSTKISTVNSDLRQFKLAIQRYSFDIGEYPKKLEDLIYKPADKEAVGKWHDPFIEPAGLRIIDGKICDPWNTPYQYRVTKGQKLPFALHSNGNPEAEEPVKYDVWTAK